MFDVNDIINQLLLLNLGILYLKNIWVSFIRIHLLPYYFLIKVYFLFYFPNSLISYNHTLRAKLIIVNKIFNNTLFFHLITLSLSLSLSLLLRCPYRYLGVTWKKGNCYLLHLYWPTSHWTNSTWMPKLSNCLPKSPHYNNNMKKIYMCDSKLDT